MEEKSKSPEINPLDVINNLKTQGNIESNSFDDIMLITGIFHPESGKDILSSIESNHKKTLEIQKGSTGKQKEIIQSTISKYESELEVLKSLRTENEANIVKGLESVAQLESELEECNIKRRAIVKEIIKHREEYPEKLLADNIDKRKRLRKQVYDTFKDEWESTKGIKRKIYDDAMELRKLNEKEYDRRITFLKDRIDRATKEFNKLEDLILQLGKVGINRTSIGFLVWAGHACMPALGWLIGELLIKQFQGNLGVFQKIFGLLVLAESTLFEWFGFTFGMIVIILLPLFFIIVLLMFYLSLRQLAAKLVPERKKKGNSAKEGANDFLGNALGKFPFNQFGYLQGASKQASDNAQSIFTGYLWLLIPLLLGALFHLGIKNPNYQLLKDEIQNATAYTDVFFPWGSLFFTYLGVVICLVFAGFVTVYVVRVIQPRLLLSLEPNSSKTPSLVKINIELVVLVFMIVGGTVFYDGSRLIFPSIPNIWNSENLTIVFLLVLANAVSIAYGISFRGVFRDAESHKSEIQLYEDEMQRYSTLPSFDLPEDLLGDFDERIKVIEREIEGIWRKSDIVLPSPSDGIIFPFIHRQNTEVTKTVDTPQKNRESESQLSNYDSFYQSELSSQLLTIHDLMMQKEQKKQNILKNIEEMKNEITQSKEKENITQNLINESIERIQKMEREAIELATKIEIDFMSLLSRASNAIRLGQIITGKKGI